jgi:hypothetical protein
MTSAVSEPSTRRGTKVWVREETYSDLLQYRRGDEPMDAVIQRLIRFAKRYAPAAQAHIREQFLP